MSTACIVCNIVTSKYRCPNCLERYCSVACCKVHKETCVKQTSASRTNETGDTVKAKENDSFNKCPLVQSQTDADDSDDKVPDELLHKLEQSSDLKEVLSNPHLRALLENLVNTENPEQAMANAMHEPIFAEFADLCLQIVDKNNPNMEQLGV